MEPRTRQDGESSEVRPGSQQDPGGPLNRAVPISDDGLATDVASHSGDGPTPDHGPDPDPAPTPAAPPPDPRPTRTRLTAADRKTLILQAAAEVFAESGYQRGKMSEVARRVGVSEPVVFQNFGSKAALFALVVTAAGKRVSAGWRALASVQEDVGEWLRYILAPEHLAVIHQRGSMGVLLADALSVPGEPAVAEASREATRTVAETIADLLAQGQEDGSIRADLDPRTGAWWLLSLFASQHFRFAAAPDPRGLEAEMAAATLKLLLATQP